MTAERASFKWGGVTFPIPTATGNTALRDVDPVLYYATAFWTQVLRTYMGAAWIERATGAGVAATVAADVVASTISYDPIDSLQQDQMRFPLLAVWRASDKAVGQSEQWTRTDAAWVVDYVWPPMTPAQMRNLMPLMRAVFPILVRMTLEGGDASYAAGARIWTLSGVQEIEFVDARYGSWPSVDGGKLRFPAVRMTVKCIERADLVTGGFDLLNGTDAQVDVQDTDGGLAPHVADFKT